LEASLKIHSSRNSVVSMWRVLGKYGKGSHWP
jgi:hypothetical protein